jgi:hydrogenase nickel incorporation protein HypB
MNPGIKYIDLKQQILSRNADQAGCIRAQLHQEQVFLLNLMSSPGSGKTSVIVESIRILRDSLRVAVIEGDIESLVDSEKIVAEGVSAVQLRTGGSCHLDAAMVSTALERLSLDALDLIFVENIGNLVCPAEFDLGATKTAMILSVPEGDDKILKYPVMFSVVDALIVNKTDYLSMSNFDIEALRNRMANINPHARIFEISCKTGEGVADWCSWLSEQIRQNVRRQREHF